MENKKGFTLVELLGVIVVLAILSIITIPIISNVITNVRIKSLESSAYGLIEASNLYYVSNGISNTTRFDKNANEDTLKELKYKGSVKEGTVIIDKIGKVTVCVSDGKNSAYKNYNESKVTTVKGKHCSIEENSSIIYLDDEATITQYDNTKLTELVTELQEKVKKLEDSKGINNIYPIGSVYISFVDTNPSTLFGGEWEQIESGYMLQSTSTTSGQTGGQSSYSYTPEGTVGDTTLTINQIPSHSHSIVRLADNKTTSWIYDSTPWRAIISSYVDGNSPYRQYHNTGDKGGSQPHTHSFIGTTENIPTVSPYITVYMYKRTA